MKKLVIGVVLGLLFLVVNVVDYVIDINGVYVLVNFKI